jgi:UDP-N-acetylglucosamine 4-epimerase
LLTFISNKKITPIYASEREGDIKHSRASIEKIRSELNYNPTYSFEEGLKVVFNWYQSNQKIVK